MTNQRRISLFDNTRISSFKVCARKYYFEHVRFWRPDEKSVALTFGGAWHASMDVVWDAQRKDAPEMKKRDLVDMAMDAFLVEWKSAGLPPPEEMSPDDLENFAPRTLQIAREMLHNYIDERAHIFKDPSFKVLGIEQPFAVPLDPTDPTLFYVGRLDKEFEYRKQVYVGEHKTTTSYKKGGPFRSDFIDGFAVSSQIDGYVYALRSKYRERAAGVWIDGALVHKTVHDGFRFVPETRSDEVLDSWLWETMIWTDGIKGNMAALEERKHDDTPYLAAFPRNTNSCLQYGRCPFLDICRVIANPAKLDAPPLGYKIEKWSPFDTLKLEKLGFVVENTTEGEQQPCSEGTL